MKKNEETQTVETSVVESVSDKVVVQTNVPWIIDYPGRGRVQLHVGQTTEFDVHDDQQLTALLTVVKEINRPKTNRRLRLNKVAGKTEYEYYQAFTIVSGENALPKVLREHSYTESGMLTNDERSAIKALCPGFQFERPRPRPQPGY